MIVRILSMTCMGLFLAVLEAKGHVTEAALWLIFVAASVLVAVHESLARAEAKCTRRAGNAAR